MQNVVNTLRFAILATFCCLSIPFCLLRNLVSLLLQDLALCFWHVDMFGGELLKDLILDSDKRLTMAKNSRALRKEKVVEKIIEALHLS